MSRRRQLIFTRLSIPYPLRQDHERRGGRDLRRWVARVPDGMVRVLAGREPIGEHVPVENLVNRPDGPWIRSDCRVCRRLLGYRRAAGDVGPGA